MSLFSRPNYAFIALPGIRNAAQAQQERIQTHGQEAHFCGQKEALLILLFFAINELLSFSFVTQGISESHFPRGFISALSIKQLFYFIFYISSAHYFLVCLVYEMLACAVR